MFLQSSHNLAFNFLLVGTRVWSWSSDKCLSKRYL